jgi:hypothetical protein
MLAGVPPPIQQRILQDNAAELYRIELPEPRCRQKLGTGIFDVELLV